MKKGILSFVLAILMIFSSNIIYTQASTIVASGSCGENATWTLDGEGTLTISGTGAIADHSFYGFTSSYNVTELVIEEGITSIGAYAFYNCGFTGELVLPSSLTSINYNAFAGCSGFTGDLIIPDSITSISSAIFAECSGFTGKLVIPDGVTSIGGTGAFLGCSGLTGNLNIPNSVTFIGALAFANCSGFTGELVIPEGVTSIAYDAFSGCSGFTGDLVIPQSVASIDERVFNDCSGLERIIFTNSECIVYDSADTLPTNAIIAGYTGSTAQVYAQKYNRTFEALDSVIENTFTDIFEGQYYYNPVLWAVENNITSGINATEFGPETVCTRGQVITFIWRANGSPEPQSLTTPFEDIHSWDYYYKAILWAVENGIASGSTDTTFSPNAEATRGQIVTFLWRAENKPTAATTQSTFTDVINGTYYYNAVLWAVENGITAGTSETTFEPNAVCTRGQVVTFLYRAFGK